MPTDNNNNDDDDDDDNNDNDDDDNGDNNDNDNDDNDGDGNGDGNNNNSTIKQCTRVTKRRKTVAVMNDGQQQKWQLLRRNSARVLRRGNA
jgi:hypothetical protein